MSVQNTHIQYNNNLPKWTKCRNSIEGEVKGYVPRLADQSDDEYKAYIERPSFFNATSRTLDALVGLIHSKEAEINIPSQIALMAENITLDDDTLEDFAKNLTVEALAVGRVGVLVDMPSVDRSQYTQAQAEALNLRPYARMYKAESIANWYSVNVNGVNKLSMVVLKESYEADTADEFTKEDKIRYRVLDLYDGYYRQRIFQEVNKAYVAVGEVLPMANGLRLDYIPFIFIGASSLKSSCDKPPLMDLVEVNISHFKNEVDLEHGCHFTALPTPVITGYQGANNEKLKIGSTSIFTFSDPNAKAFYLEFSGTGLSTLENRAAVKEKRMAVLGARLLLDEKKTAEATETVAMRSSGERSVLMSVAMTISSGITKILQIISEWENVSGDIVYNLNTDYNLNTMDAQLLAQLMAGVQGGTIPASVLFYNMQQGELIEEGMEYEEFQAGIETAPPTLSVTNEKKTDTSLMTSIRSKLGI